MTALALKMFSATSQTRKLYRFLGNSLGASKRSSMGLPGEYVERAKLYVDLFEKNRILEPGARLLELGTGWVHWESTALRLFNDVQVTMFDPWDNRQLEPYQAWWRQMEPFLEDFPIAANRQGAARALLGQALSAQSFDELYGTMGFNYVVNPTGKLDVFEEDTFRALFSNNVFEHISKEIVVEYIRDLYRVLQPGGYSVHTIDMGDHLVKYDLPVCRKNYLRYSERVWKLFFENSVQYFNRIQRTEWLQMFEDAGFELLDEIVSSREIPTPIHPDHGHLDRKDVECTHIQVVHRK